MRDFFFFPWLKNDLFSLKILQLFNEEKLEYNGVRMGSKATSVTNVLDVFPSPWAVVGISLEEEEVSVMPWNAVCAGIW